VQRERALQSWELFVDEPIGPPERRALRKVLRLKRFEVDAIVGRLPGAVRRGARVDLAPLEAALREAGVRCELRRRSR